MAPLRASLAASRPPPRAAPRRRGVPPPGPPGLRPLWPLGHGPLLPADQEGGKRSAQAEGRRVSGLRGKFLKRWAVRSAAGGSGGRAPRCSGAGGNAWAGGGRAGGNAQRCPRRPRAAALSTAERATGRSG